MQRGGWLVHIRRGNAWTQCSRPGRTLPIVKSPSWREVRGQKPPHFCSCSTGNWHQPVFRLGDIGSNPYFGPFHLLVGVRYLKPLIIGENHNFHDTLLVYHCQCNSCSRARRLIVQSEYILGAVQLLPV